MSEELRSETKGLDFHRAKKFDFHRACLKFGAEVAIASATLKFILHELDWLLSLLGIHFN